MNMYAVLLTLIHATSLTLSVVGVTLVYSFKLLSC